MNCAPPTRNRPDPLSFTPLDELQRCCDLVLRGGITSGIVYPLAICRIAEQFALMSIGGTSAGAIAGSLAAAAEYRRRLGSTDGFERLARLPAELGTTGRMLSLFRPDAPTRRLFAQAAERMRLNARDKRGPGWWLSNAAWAARVAWTLVGSRRHARLLIQNGYGLCSGMGNGTSWPVESPPLNAWLHATINEIAGRSARDPPLTFGDLWDAPAPPRLRDVMTSVSGPPRSIDFRAVTTCLTFARPFELPADSSPFAFDREELGALFPAPVMKHLVQCGETSGSGVGRAEGKLPFPMGREMPIVVAVRMSLSFPGLISMVPLWAVNYDAGKDRDGRHPLQRVWFSDGGITSNFPVHRFDALLPRWPTLAINLRYAGPGGLPQHVDASSLVYLPAERGGGPSDAWYPFADGTRSGLADLVGFGGAIFRAAQVWHDNAFLKLPGFRDRFAEVWLRPGEGGLNLEMPQCIIDRLVKRGERCGILLRDRFRAEGDAHELGWQGHRWTRTWSGLSALLTYLHELREDEAHRLPGNFSPLEWLGERTPPTYMRMPARQRSAARAVFLQLLELAEFAHAQRVCEGPEQTAARPFCGGPRPAVILGTRAPF
jgi:predicted acylesterase/phospholipase RssA